MQFFKTYVFSVNHSMINHLLLFENTNCECLSLDHKELVTAVHWKMRFLHI